MKNNEKLNLPETLEVGDYIPFIEINCENSKKHIHSYCNENPFMFITIDNLSNLCSFNLPKKFNTIVVFEENEYLHNRLNNVLYTTDQQLRNILQINREPLIYITSPNRRILSIMHNNVNNIYSLNYNDYTPQNVYVPYLMIENVLSDNLLKKVIDYYYEKKIENKLTEHKQDNKYRLHIHPDCDLECEIDHKLSRSILPELRKVFYFDAQYRETYKICSYDSEMSGRFHPHRDTPAPHQHRKYALSLLLNDDYEGGEFYLPEYGLKLKPKSNTALIFPGISTHQILPVTKGSRMTIISFFVNDITRPQYKMKMHFFKDKNIVDSSIYPY